MKLDVNTLSVAMVSAYAESENSPCTKKKVGSSLIGLDSNAIVSTGYGGFIEKCNPCVRKIHDWQQDGCWSIHSEMRAIFNYFNKFCYRQDLSKYILVVTHGPCDQCIKLAVYFKIPLIVYDIDYHNDYSKWNKFIKIISFAEVMLKRKKLENKDTIII